MVPTCKERVSIDGVLFGNSKYLVMLLIERAAGSF
jgi:hypothetical protein